MRYNRISADCQIGPKLLNVNDLMTTDTLMWGSDYPHTDGIWPESTKYI